MSGIAARLSEVLGINGRNIDYLSVYNDRRTSQIADDKLLTKRMLDEAGIPNPRLLGAYRWFWELSTFERDCAAHTEMVINPAGGLGGGGVLILENNHDGSWQTPGDRRFTVRDLAAHALDILYGVYSIDNTTDALIVEERIHPHPFFTRISSTGVADLRVILFKGEAVMAMCRVPTLASDGTANLSRGAIGLGINMETGVFTRAVSKKGPISVHPDTHQPLTGKTVPFWSDILEVSRRLQREAALGYMGVDILVDENRGPLVLELNARPGLEIQNANGWGLRPILERQIRKGDTSL